MIFETASSKYTLVSNVANGYFDIDMGYSLFSTEGRVVIVHDGTDKIACSVLTKESSLAMEYDITNLDTNSEGGKYFKAKESVQSRIWKAL